MAQDFRSQVLSERNPAGSPGHSILPVFNQTSSTRGATQALTYRIETIRFAFSEAIQ